MLLSETCTYAVSEKVLALKRVITIKKRCCTKIARNAHKYVFRCRHCLVDSTIMYWKLININIKIGFILIWLPSTLRRPFLFLCFLEANRWFAFFICNIPHSNEFAWCRQISWIYTESFLLIDLHLHAAKGYSRKYLISPMVGTYSNVVEICPKSYERTA